MDGPCFGVCCVRFFSFPFVYFLFDFFSDFFSRNLVLDAQPAARDDPPA